MLENIKAHVTCGGWNMTSVMEFVFSSLHVCEKKVTSEGNPLYSVHRSNFFIAFFTQEAGIALATLSD